jgi:hypothetical protein
VTVRRCLLVPLVLLALQAIAACGGSGAGSTSSDVTVTVTRTVFTTPGTSVPVPADGPLTASGYKAITTGLRKMLGRDPLLLEIGLYESYAFFRVYDRSTGFADDYNWRDGLFAPPQPYKLGSTDLPRELFALEEVDPAGPDRFIRAVAQIPLDGAGDDSPSVLITRGFSSSDEPAAIVMRTGVDGTRQYLSVTGDRHGTIIEKRLS